MAKSTKAHPGLAAVAAKIAKQKGISLKEAQKILAARTRRMSPAAKKANPRLNKVKGKPKKK